MSCERRVQRFEEDSGDRGDDLRAAAKVVGYRFALPGEDDPGTPRPSGFSLVQSDGTVDFGQLEVLKREATELTAAQIDTLVTAVYEEDDRTSAAACYDPHHIFLFHDDAGEVIRVVEICFSCTHLRAHPELQEERWRRHDFRALARLCEEIGIGLGAMTAEQFIEVLDERERR